MIDQKEVVIVSAARTPFGKFDGLMRDMPSIDLGIVTLKEVLKRLEKSSEPVKIDELYYGTCIPAEYAPYLNVPARQITLLAGLPVESLSMTIDRACCSSMTALRLGFRAIRAGDAEVVVACGAENMGHTCLLVRPEQARWGNRLGHMMMEDILFELGYAKKGFNPVALDAGEVALEYQVSREDQDRWGVNSQLRWAEAYKAGKFKPGEEIVPVEISQKRGPTVILDADEPPRSTTLEKLSKLPTIYGSPTVTPGNAPGLNAGASAMVIMSRAKAESLGLAPMAVIEAMDWTAGDPRYMATLPAIAVNKVLHRLNRTIDDLDLIEINEAFAAVTLVSLKILAEGNPDTFEALCHKTNVNGGAIAIGHPVGASGARISMTLMYELMRRGGGRGTAAICGGLGQAEALVLRV